MKIHEYQAKAILAKFGVPVPRGEVVFKKDEARAVAQRLGTPVVVVKAQIHAGGRGKAGGVKLAKSADEAAAHAERILGMNLVTPQTGPEGRIVRRLLIEEGLDIKRELYLEHSRRSRGGRARVYGQHRRRNGNRRSREGQSRSDSARDDSSRHRIAAVSSAQTRLRTRTRAGSCERGGAVSSIALSRVHGDGRVARWKSIRASSPAMAASSRSMRKSPSTTTRSTAIQNSRICAISRKKRRSKWKPRNSN